MTVFGSAAPLLFAGLLVACGPLGAAPPPVPPQKVDPMQDATHDATREADDFARAIAEIGAKAKSLDVPDELFALPAFDAIYENPSPHAASARAMMARRDVGLHRKRIVALAMQRLPVEAFVALVAATADSVEQGASDVAALETVAFAPLNWGRQSLLMHYDEPPVQALLKRLMDMPQLPLPRRIRIREGILTGRAKLEYVDYMDMIGRPVRE
ncbi:MAG: hypothetical protein ABW032_08355 [Burkholderiaceae bacterium]